MRSKNKPLILGIGHSGKMIVEQFISDYPSDKYTVAIVRKYSMLYDGQRYEFSKHGDDYTEVLNYFGIIYPHRRIIMVNGLGHKWGTEVANHLSVLLHQEHKQLVWIYSYPFRQEGLEPGKIADKKIELINKWPYRSIEICNDDIARMNPKLKVSEGFKRSDKLFVHEILKCLNEWI